MKKIKLEVRPLTKTYKPKYPSHSDPNPLDHPDSRPYPFTLKMMHNLGAVGFIGAVMLSCGVQPNGNAVGGSSHTLAQVGQDTLSNPFPMLATNLPYQPAMFGTGLPSRISSREVVELLNEAFSAEGLNAVLDTTVEIDGQLIPMSAYDPDMKIGYVWMDYKNFGEGMIDRGRRKKLDRSKKNLKKELKNDIKRKVKEFNNNPQKFLNWQSKQDPYAAKIKANLIANLNSEKTEKQKQKYLKKKISEYVMQLSINRVIESTNKDLGSKWRKSAVERISDKEALYITLSRLYLVSRFSNFEAQELATLESEIKRIMAHKDLKEWIDHTDALIDLLLVGAYSRYDRYAECRALVIDIISDPDYKNWKERYYEINEMIDRKQISMEELESLTKEGRKKEYIAPVSANDDRTIAQMDRGEINMEYQKAKYEYRNETDHLKKAELKAKLAEIRKVEREQRSIKEAEAMRAQARRLQDDMRSYIRWAKSQLGY